MPLLNEIKIIDLSRYLPGPFCTLNLAWLGAHVTVVEQPPHGDMLRAMSPLDDDGVSLSFKSLRRNCESIFIDLQKSDERSKLIELIKDADVLVESFRPGVTARLGVGAEAMRTLNPRLIYVSISGYGQTGPWANTPGHDLGYEAVSGLLSQTGTSDEVAPPPVPIADLAGGFVASNAILAALLKREQTGEGCTIDVSLTEAALALQAMSLPAAGGETNKRGRGMLTGGLACYGTYKCQDDEWISVAPIEPKFFKRLCTLIERPELVDMQHDPTRQQELRAELEKIFASRGAKEWEQLLVGADGGDSCVVRVIDQSEVHQHPQIIARGAVKPIGDGFMPASPYVFNGVRL